ncbi:hypothetical protein CEUSTIGMA_g6264.t1 [Chlamydomonas eustigma]|uniref:Uncharacterized protein n=1 Tax=Chlamydomonas eustigma TaxID=1157962 RepID=A0A250X6X5_9CHLO|nr:hypothetical protein CEUSTIGMA_g6264.t1 [Chlamydomonas eustigma]|eukprot:GAX78827.1 hypothetical protein CEUSTIGMA_g6264.t1 [Chlamydomonas eustigma]
MPALSACLPGANPWIEKYFHDCVYDFTDTISFGLGLASIAIWVLAQLPQFISNIKNESAEALSVWFLGQWFLGDTLNLLGCLVQGQQLPTTTFVAMYFVLSDVVMLIQFIYYGALQKRRQWQLAIMQSRGQNKRHRLGGQSAPAGALASAGGLGRHPVAGGLSVTEDTAVKESNLQNKLHLRGGLSKSSTHVLLASSMHAGVSNSNTSHLEGASSEADPCMAVRGLQNCDQEVSHAPSTPEGDSRLAGNSSPGLRTFQAATVVVTSLVGIALLAGAHGAGAPRGEAGVSGAITSADGVNAESMSSLEHWSGGTKGGSSTFKNVALGLQSHWHLKRCDDADYYGEPLPWWCEPSVVQLVAGTVLGYMATVLYLGSRVSQLAKNLARKSADGLSLSMFCMTVGANLCTGSSILLRMSSLEALKSQLPWLCGTFGTVGLDVAIAMQTLAYQRAAAEKAAVESDELFTPLLVVI